MHILLPNGNCNFLRFSILAIITSLVYSCSTVDINNERAIGLRQYNNDSLEEAVISFSKAISATDTYADCFLHRGFAFKGLKKYEKAMKDFDSFISIRKTEAVGYANRASIFYLENDYISALKDFVRAYQLDTASKVLFNPITHMLFATGQKDSSCIFYEKAMSIGDTTFNNRIKTYCNENKKH